MDRWKLIQGFSPKENWGNPDKIDFFLLMLMEKVREAYKSQYDPSARFYVNCAYETTGHIRGSQHGLGTALDFHIETVLSYWNQVRAMLSILTDLGISEKVGLGIYPDWNDPGFHLDTRMSMARWGYIGKGDDKAMVAFEVAFKTVKERGL